MLKHEVRERLYSIIKANQAQLKSQTTEKILDRIPPHPRVPKPPQPPQPPQPPPSQPPQPPPPPQLQMPCIPINLPNVTLISVSSIKIRETILSLKKSSKHIIFNKILFFTNASFTDDKKITTIPIKRLKNLRDYSSFMLKELPKYAGLFSDYILVTQWDGFVTNPCAWSDEFYKYDYIGAPWDNSICGNGGFSLRSKKLLMALSKIYENHKIEYSEDIEICHRHRIALESYGIKFPNAEIGFKFSTEIGNYYDHNSFGFHNLHYNKQFISVIEDSASKIKYVEDNRMSKTIILVLAADVSGYDKLVQSIKDTWGSIKIDGYEVLYYYGYREGYERPDTDGVIRVGDDIICGVEESIANINHKTYLTFKYLYNNYDFDYIFRCCAGSYVDRKNMTKFLENKSNEGFYCGITGEGNVASGAGYFISKDLVKLLLDNPSGFKCHPCDDVAIGWFLATKGITVQPGMRQDIDIPGAIRIIGSDSQRSALSGVANPPELPLPPLDRRQYHYHFRHNIAMMFAIHKKLSRS